MLVGMKGHNQMNLIAFEIPCRSMWRHSKKVRPM